jgi:hypothetical protein
MDAVYGGEKSKLSAPRALVPFFVRHCFNFVRRFFYGYLLRDFNVASVMALVGLPTMVFGASFGLLHWIQSIESGRAATAGTVMVSALPLILGFQLLLAALNYDVSRTPKVVLHHLLRNVRVHGLHSASPESRDQARTP